MPSRIDLIDGIPVLLVVCFLNPPPKKKIRGVILSHPKTHRWIRCLFGLGPDVRRIETKLAEPMQLGGGIGIRISGLGSWGHGLLCWCLISGCLFSSVYQKLRPSGFWKGGDP